MLPPHAASVHVRVCSTLVLSWMKLVCLPKVSVEPAAHMMLWFTQAQSASWAWTEPTETFLLTDITDLNDGICMSEI